MLPARFDLVEDRRAIIDRRAIAERIAGLPKGAQAEISAILRVALETGRSEIARRFEAEPARGRMAAASYAFLTDQLLRLAFDAARSYLVDSKPSDDSIALVGLGGTGRGEMAPFSDVDLLFLVQEGSGDDVAKLIEATLYLLWDLPWKLGHAVRNCQTLISLAKNDITIRTAFLEARWIWGDEQLFDNCTALFRKEIVTGTGAEFVSAKLAERDQRHLKLGDSRYLVEPNVKDGKGGLRDLHT